MHGSIMMYLFAVPFAFGLANYLVPLQIGAPDVAFPRLNALAYWLYLFGGIAMVSGFLTAGGAANFGWFAYAPLSGAVYSPGAGPDLWIIGVTVTSTAGVLGAVNLVTTIFMLRAPGMTMFRMPIFTWNMLVTSVMVLLAFPVLTAALGMLFADRHLGGHIFEVAKGGEPVLWQHLFWFFGHPEVYIVALPFFGVVTEILPVFSRRPVFGYKGLVFATLAIGGLSTGVWAHHMFATGVVLLPFFTALSLLIAVPTGVKFFNWIGTMWRGQLRYPTPMLFTIGFLVVFLLGGLTGVLMAMAPIDFAVTDTYFVVAHMHYVLFSAAGFAGFAAIYYWFPKFTGRMLDERLGHWHFWLFFVGFNVTFLVQHELGLRGMPRRVVTYESSEGFTFLNEISTLGSYVIGIGVLIFFWNLVRSLRHGKPAGDDPWDAADARMGDDVPATRPQLRPAAADPVRAAAVGREVPGRRGHVKVEARFYFGLAAFFAVVGTIYWFTSYEDAGSVMLAAASLLGVMAGGYLYLLSRRMTPRPGDRRDATIAEGSGPIGEFPTPTVWPFVFGLGCVILATGTVYGVWVALAGAVVVGLGLVGMVRQSRGVPAAAGGRSRRRRGLLDLDVAPRLRARDVLGVGGWVGRSRVGVADAELLAQPVREQAGHRGDDERRRSQDVGDHVHRDVEPGGQHVVAPGDEQDQEERERGDTDGGAHRPVAWSVQDVVLVAVVGEARLEERPEVQEHEGEARDQHPREEQGRDLEAEGPDLPRREQPQRALEPADVPVGLRARAHRRRLERPPDPDRVDLREHRRARRTLRTRRRTVRRSSP